MLQLLKIVDDKSEVIHCTPVSEAYAIYSVSLIESINSDEYEWDEIDIWIKIEISNNDLEVSIIPDDLDIYENLQKKIPITLGRLKEVCINCDLFYDSVSGSQNVFWYDPEEDEMDHAYEFENHSDIVIS